MSRAGNARLTAASHFSIIFWQLDDNGTRSSRGQCWFVDCEMRPLHLRQATAASRAGRHRRVWTSSDTTSPRLDSRARCRHITPCDRTSYRAWRSESHTARASDADAHRHAARGTHSIRAESSARRACPAPRPRANETSRSANGMLRYRVPRGAPGGRSTTAIPPALYLMFAAFGATASMGCRSRFSSESSSARRDRGIERTAGRASWQRIEPGGRSPWTVHRYQHGLHSNRRRGDEHAIRRPRSRRRHVYRPVATADARRDRRPAEPPIRPARNL